MFSSWVMSKFVSFLRSYQFFGHYFEVIQEWICDVSATSPLQAIVPRVLLLEIMWCVQLALCGCWSYTLCTNYAWRADLFGDSSGMELRIYDVILGMDWLSRHRVVLDFLRARVPIAGAGGSFYCMHSTC
ncbi:hypothetical protein F2Q70_00029784 [Brassica cretica]|uniref:Uncharacterized protein n=1 Tax=Brassica cretica TaxID=69181 RepID=A0A8S9FGA3_BRACR|nr:hypothetical protein F2Q70_00029784 [Brassica cretica]